MPLSELDRLLLEEEPEEERLSGLDQALLGVPEEVPTEEPPWWVSGWREYEERMGLPAERPWHERLGAVAKTFTPWGITGEDIERISVAPEWQGIQQKIKSGTVLTEDEISFVDNYLAGHATRPPGFTAEQWLAQPKALQTGYNVATTIAIIMGVTAPIWTHPSFPRMTKATALKLYRGKLPERIPVEAERMVVKKGKFLGVEPVITMRPPSMKISAPSVAREFATIKPAIVKSMNALQFKDTIHKQLYELVSKYKPNPSTVDMKPFYQTADHITGPSLIAAAKVLAPGYLDTTYSQINQVLPFMINQLVTSGTAIPQIRKELEAEEKIVDEEMVRPLTPTPEEYAAPEVALKAVVPEEKIPKEVVPKEEIELIPEQEQSLAGGPVLGKGFDIVKGWPIIPEPEKGTLGKAIDKTLKTFSVYTRIKKEEPEMYFRLREFKGGEGVAFTKAKQTNEKIWGRITQNEALAIQRYRQIPEKYPLEKLAEKLRPAAGRLDAVLEEELEDFIAMEKMTVGWPYSRINELNEEKENLLAEIPLLKQEPAIQKRQDRIAEIDELTDMLKSRRFFPGRYTKTPETQSSVLKFLPEGVFRGSRLREKWISGKTIPDIDAAIEVGLEPLDPRAAMLRHLFWAELEKNKWILHEGIKSNPNLAIPEEYAPEWWDDYPAIKGYKLNPLITDVLREFDMSTRTEGVEAAYRKFAAIGKRAVFWNFIIMGGVYDPQQGFRAAGWGAINPVSYARNIKSVITKDEGYKFWSGLDLFSKPVDIQPQRDVKQLIESAIRQMDETTPKYSQLIERLTDGEWNFKDTTKIQKVVKAVKGLSSLEWNLAWGLDAASRKTTAERLVAIGLSPREAAEQARFHHADYGDVPGKTRRFLNLGMLTPTYQIASGKVYLNMMRHPVKERGPIARTIGFQILMAIGMGILGYRWTRGNVFVKKIDKTKEDVISNPGPLYWLNKQIRDPRVSVYWQSSVPLNILLSVVTNNDGLGGRVYDRKASKEWQYTQTAEFVIKRWLRPLESAGRLTDESRLLLDRLLSLVAITKYQRKPWKEKKKISKYWWR